MPRFGRMKYRPRRRRRGGRKKVSVWRKMLNCVPRIPRTFNGMSRAIAGIRNLINVESKYIDTFTNASPDATTGVVTPLTLVAQGTTDITRIGNSILSKNLSMNLRCAINPSSTTRVTVGWILFVDKQNAGGTAPTVANLLESVTPEAHINKNFSDRFVILRRGTFDLSMTGTQVASRKVFVNLSHLHIKYDGTSVAQGDAAENHIYLASCSSDGTNIPSLRYDVRYTFYDN